MFCTFQVIKCVPSAKRLVLTNNKTLIRSKLKTVTSVRDATVGEQLDAVVVAVREQGVVVVFYNDLKGWVPRRQLSRDPIEFPEKIFYVGQVVRCRVKEVEVDANKLVLSLIVSHCYFPPIQLQSSVQESNPRA